MQLSYINSPGGTQSIKVLLAEGEALGSLHGPVEGFVPMDPENTDYALIVENDYPIEPAAGG